MGKEHPAQGSCTLQCQALGDLEHGEGGVPPPGAISCPRKPCLSEPCQGTAIQCLHISGHVCLWADV